MADKVEELWQEWAHYNWDDNQDMAYAEKAFKAGHEAANQAK